MACDSLDSSQASFGTIFPRSGQVLVFRGFETLDVGWFLDYMGRGCVCLFDDGYDGGGVIYQTEL